MMGHERQPLRHEGTNRPWDPETGRGPMPATVRAYQKDHPDQWDAVRALTGRFPHARLIEEPEREQVLAYPTTVGIDVVLGWPLGEREDDGAFWGDVVQLRLETPGQRYPLGGIMAYVREGVIEREAFREHQPLTGAVTWFDTFEEWLAVMTANMSTMEKALIAKGWLTEDGIRVPN